MKTTGKLVIAVAALFPTWAANPYAIVWSSVEGGGGASTGGPYAVSGGVAKSDGTSAGGTFAASGGFWSVVAVHEPGEPRLYIAHQTDTDTVRVFWPSRFSNLVLEQSPDLADDSWSDSSHPVSDNGVTRSITFTPQEGRMFFRLRD